ncbi:putative peptide chain release factor C12orf65, mitochondrial [Orchesella cincta]|uniref:Putative peptide chain release factor C12orf65, mitochondrial n=1 Tax=Orchesella cincta TaxID=48709 RepID=A0A1D2NC97_ORCCI|nr:putative peptide chain release factor C12orf65, mitochondrial [Orchesella cincta]
MSRVKGALKSIVYSKISGPATSADCDEVIPLGGSHTESHEFCVSVCDHAEKTRYSSSVQEAFEILQQPKYTDKNYYQDRIRGEFWRNRELTESEEVQFQFQRQLQHTSLSASPFKFGIDNLYPYQFRRKHSEIDTSKVPILNEDDLEEWFIKGSGPGGSNVNKRTNCCSLRHKPTGIILKCHLARELNQNRKLARQMMIEKLDEHFNGDESIAAQKKRLGLEKTHAQEVKAKKVFEMKKRYKDLVHPAEAASDDGSARETSSEKIS